ncbi:MAG: BatA domain-containing protein, partial [Longimicrobiales bacterium]
MGALAPALLALAAAAAVPLLLHLFQRHQGPRMVFPALRYLRRAERESARRVRLRQILLLVVRMTAVILVAAAAARPFVRVGGPAHRPTAVVIVLDNSLSSGVVLGERRLLDQLKLHALETLSAGGTDDRFWLLRAGEPWSPVLAGAADLLADQIRQTEVQPTRADLSDAMRRAQAVLTTRAEGRAAEIHLLSDLQASAFPGSARVREGAAAVVAYRARALPPNDAVTDVELGGGLAPRAGSRSTVGGRARIAGDSGVVRLVVDGSARAAMVVRGDGTFAFPLTVARPGLLQGWVETGPDALRADDRRYFGALADAAPAVALATGSPFLGEALEALVSGGRVRAAAVDGADLVVAPGGIGADAWRRGARGVVALA